jgi:hypothetical protein
VKKLTVLATLAIAVFLVAVSSASAALPNQRTDLKVLLLAATGTEPTTGAWEAALKREGVPYDKKIATADEPYTAETFATTMEDGTPRAKYQAVILATGGLPYADENGNWGSALGSEEWAALADFESRYGIRQIVAFTWPSAEYGLNSPTVSGELAGVTGRLTAAGATVFPYLKGPVPIDTNTYGYQATPATGANFKPLVSGPNGSALVGINTRPDGREEMVSTVDGNAHQIHSALLRHGMLAWVTRGTYLGAERNYMTVHVDDVFLASETWDPVRNTESTTNLTRMSPSDVLRAVLWSAAQSFRLDLLFNASGSDARGGSRDRLTQYLQAYKSRFNWINHTYSGEPNNDTSYEHVVSDIQRNRDWARARGINLDPTELVFDQHSGFNNPNVAPALTATGVKWVGDDASRYFDMRSWAEGATSVPRYPSNIYYNTATRTQQLDEYNYLYLPPSLGGVCQNSSTTTCFTQPATWNQYVDSEATIMLRHVLGNDPRPHYVHQANLAGDGILYHVMNEVLRRYRSYYRTPIIQPTQRTAGELLDTQAKWNTVKDQVDAFIQNGQIRIVSDLTSSVQVPITGITGIGGLYGGLTSGWQPLAPGGVLQLKLPL